MLCLIGVLGPATETDIVSVFLLRTYQMLTLRIHRGEDMSAIDSYLRLSMLFEKWIAVYCPSDLVTVPQSPRF